MSIRMEVAAVDRAVADVRAAAGLLEGDERAIDRRVRTLLDSGWTGAAADSFVEAWEDWKAATDQIREALDGMGDLLGATRRDLVEQDRSSQRALDAVAGRLTDRLG